jgi:hypothetical protein
MSELKMSGEEDYNPDKIKVTSAEIVVHGTVDKPYYEIKYYKLNDRECHIGYSSYELRYVFKWLNECFDICEKHVEDKPQVGQMINTSYVINLEAEDL